MSVASNFRIETRPYSGYADPSLPVGAWITQGVLAGNATGGAVQMNFLFQFGNNPLNSQLYSLEQFTAETNASVTEVADFETINMDRLTPNLVLPVTRQQFPVIADGIGSAIAQLGDMAGLPFWLGGPNTALLECSIRFQFTNTNLRVYTVSAQGYIWGPRSVTAPGGPQRPPNGFFG